MVTPHFFGLPVLPDFDSIFYVVLLLIFEVFFGRRKAVTSTRVVEHFLTSGDVLVALVLPQNGSAVVTPTGEECANIVPAHTVYRLLVVGQFRQLPDTFEFLLLVQALHHVDVGFVSGLLVLAYLGLLIGRNQNLSFDFSFFGEFPAILRQT